MGFPTKSSCVQSKKRIHFPELDIHGRIGQIYNSSSFITAHEITSHKGKNIR